MLRLLALALIACCVFAAQTPLQSADAKMKKFEEEKWKPGEIVVFTPAEIEAWVRNEVPMAVPQGIRDPRVELGAGAGTASAMVDFVKIEESRGKTPGMIAKMFSGERPLKVYLRLESSGGRCTVTPTRVEVGGAVVEGRILDVLISTFFRPLYPDAKIGEPFDLDYNIESIQLRPEGIRVAIKK